MALRIQPSSDTERLIRGWRACGLRRACAAELRRDHRSWLFVEAGALVASAQVRLWRCSGHWCRNAGGASRWLDALNIIYIMRNAVSGLIRFVGQDRSPRPHRSNRPLGRFRLSGRPHVYTRRSPVGTLRYGLVVADLQHCAGMAPDDGRCPRRGGHPICTAPKGLCHNEIQRHLPCRGNQNSPGTAVGRGSIRSRRRAVQCRLHEPWAEATPARVRRFRRGAAPTPQATLRGSHPSWDSESSRRPEHEYSHSYRERPQCF